MSVSYSPLGQPIPADTPHAVSVSLPTWRSNVGYEEGQEWVTAKMQTGYPRFFVQKPITALAELILRLHGRCNEGAILFPCPGAAARFCAFVKKHGAPDDAAAIRTLNFAPVPGVADDAATKVLQLSAALYPNQCAKLAKIFWQHTGEGISSRRAEYCRKMLEDGALTPKIPSKDTARDCKGPRRYRRQVSSEINGVQDVALQETDGNAVNGGTYHGEQVRFVEERYGRNLNLEMTGQAKLALRRRIAGSLTSTVDLPKSLEEPVNLEQQPTRSDEALSPFDIFLYPGGMNAIYHTHQTILTMSNVLGTSNRKAICFGFPYIDTLKVLEKFNPAGCLFYGRGDSNDLDDLENRLQSGERFLALFCEFPSNPLLRTPDLRRLKALADNYDFLLVVDETIGNFLNIHILPFVDVVVSSLTKVFSGDSNVMGGAAVLNPHSRHFQTLKRTWELEYEDMYWPEDAIFLERNSRDFISRIARINDNAEAIVSLLSAAAHVKDVYYPMTSDTRPFYDAHRTPKGGYGGLLSVTFHNLDDAATFYDALGLAKGPSLGTNFTLASPYTLLAHYNELEWAESLGVPAALVRFSVGLEDKEHLVDLVADALRALESKYTV
ncbi:MAG: hypothetical protein Q9162_002084 [Coniocarpon cinnabarinum]